MHLKKVHFAALTNLTEGMVENEHMTIEYHQAINGDTAIQRMKFLNSFFPLDLNMLFIPNKLSAFKSWEGDWILTPETNYMRFEKPFTSIFPDKAKPHITLAKMAGNWPNMMDAEKLNWGDGLICDQVYIGFKVMNQMMYFNTEELISFVDNFNSN